jgi:hypothetical protein
MGLVLAVVLSACGGGGGDASTPVVPVTPTPTPTPTAAAAAVASILLSTPSPLVLSADGSSKTLTIRALDAAGGLVKGVPIGLATTGATILSSSAVTTDATGLATVTLIANTLDQSNRTAKVTASCASCAASSISIDIAINGATLALTSNGGTTITTGAGNAITLSAQVMDSTGHAVPKDTVVNFSSSDGSKLSVGTASAKTDTAGIAQTTVVGQAVGTARVVASVPSLSTQNYTDFIVQSAGGALAFVSPPTTMVTGITQTLQVNAPGASKFSVATTLGAITSASTINASAGFVDLLSSQAGSATVTVADDLGHSASIVIAVSPPAANFIVINANQTTVGLKTSTSTPSVRLTATALYVSGNSQQPVANVPILFSMSGGPGAGEFLDTAYKLTDSSGNADATFYSGTRVSIQSGIVVSAMVQNTAVQTGTPNNGPNTKLTIGGTALSVGIGQASAIRQSTDQTLYILDHSVQVTDANNNPVANQLVTLKLRPIAFSLGSGCALDLDKAFPTESATYCSEDANGNGSLDSSEDGVRKLTSVATASQCATLASGVAGTPDKLLTPQNSVGGSVPATVTTDATGIASFSLTYLKASAIWLVDELSANVSSAGTESGSSTIFRLPATRTDTNPCVIPNSPFAY